MEKDIKNLEKIFFDQVLPRYEEIKEEIYALSYTKSIRKKNLAEIQFHPSQFNTPNYYLIQLNKETLNWSKNAKATLFAHELGHVLVWKGYLPSTGDIEESISLQAVSRGFGAGFREIFSQFCQEPCWKFERGPNGEIKVSGGQRESGGLRCSIRVLGSQYCPFSDEKVKISILTHIGDPKIACALCSTQIKKNALKCENCQSQFHHYCIEPWLKQESTCPICKVILVDENP